MNTNRGSRSPGSARRRPGFLLLLAALALAAVAGLGASSSTAQPAATVNAAIDWDGIQLNNWTEGTTVAVTVGGVSHDVTIGPGGYGQLGRETHGVDIAPGTEITATDGATTRALTVADVRVTSIDASADTVAGTAPAGPVHVWVNQPGAQPVGSADTTADANGDWTAAFDVDVTAGMGAGASVADADGDTTSNFKQPSAVNASVDSDYVWLGNWSPGNVTLVTGPDTRTVAIDASGNAMVRREVHGQDITPGMTVQATQGAVTKTLSVANLRITAVDAANDVVTGVGPAGSTVQVGLRPSAGSPPSSWLFVTVDSGGNWSASFPDIVPGTGAQALVSDADGDSTGAEWTAPNIVASIQGDWVSLNRWTPGSTVTLQIGDATREVAIDASGNANVGRQLHGQDIAAGTTITATLGATVRTLVVADLRVTLDAEHDSVSGLAPALRTVHVTVLRNGSMIGQADAAAGASGEWSVGFPFDVRFADQAVASVPDADDDITMAQSSPPPGIETSIQGNWISLGNWTPGSTVALEIDGRSQDVVIDGSGGMPGSAWVQWYGLNIEPGVTIRASDGTTTKTLVVADVRIATVDVGAGVVTGTAPAGADVQVYVTGPGLFSAVNTTADGSGSWRAEFTGVDLASGRNVSAAVTDDDGDRTNAERPLVLNPVLAASSDTDEIWLLGWAPESTVRLDIGGVERDATVGGSGDGYVGREEHGQDIQIGTTITATQGTTTKTLVLWDVRITSVDLAADTVTGLARPNQGLTVIVNRPDGPPVGSGPGLAADENGNWSVSLAGTVDITTGMNVTAEQEDADADLTRASRYLQPPTIFANVCDETVGLGGWTPGSTLTVHIGGFAGTVTADAGGWASLGPETHGQDIAEGMLITAAAGGTEKSLTVARLGIADVDLDGDVVTGAAEPGATVAVSVHDPANAEPPLGSLQAAADAAGNWSANFHGSVDVTTGVLVLAGVFEPGGGGTFCSRLLGGPTVEAGGPYTVAEGSSVALQGSGTGAAPLAYEWQGADGRLADRTDPATRFNGLDDGDVALTLVVTDAAGLTASDTATVTVTNRPPLVSPFLADTGSKRQLEIHAGFLDPGRLDTHTAVVLWGDGSQSAGAVHEWNGIGSVSASHQYARKGTYTVKLTVRDDDGGEAVVQRQIKVQ